MGRMDFADSARSKGEEAPMPTPQEVALARSFLVSAINAELRRGRDLHSPGASTEAAEHGHLRIEGGKHHRQSRLPRSWWRRHG